MGKSRKQGEKIEKTLNAIAESNQTIAKNTKHTNEKLDNIKSDIGFIRADNQDIAKNTVHTNEKLDRVGEDTAVIRKSSESKIPAISLAVAIMTLIVGISGVSIYGIYEWWRSKSGSEVEVQVESETGLQEEAESRTNETPVAEESEYKIYLYSEYNTTIHEGVETDMTATLNFETDAVTITAYLETGEEVEMPLEEKNATEWQKKVVFDEVGVHEVVASATAPNGEIIRDSIKVEVIPYGISGKETQIFNEVFDSLVEVFQTEMN